MSLFNELKRRNVFRIGAAYIVVAWLVIQVGDVAAENFEAPGWVMKMTMTGLLLLFPIVLFFSWAYEITLEGIKKESEVDRNQSISGRPRPFSEVILDSNYISIAFWKSSFYYSYAPSYSNQKNGLSFWA
ncbi:MAG: hypothetical protein ACI9H8_001635 [Lysobacterales bacterium]